MKAGRMTYKLVLLKPQTLETATGSKRTEYVEQRTVWAERVKMTGNTSMEVGEMFSTYQTAFNIRDAHPVGEKWRVRVLGEDNLYNVSNIIPNRDRGFNQLICERVNE